MDPRIERMADVLVNYSIHVKPGDWVAIRTPLPGEPLAIACVDAVIRAGGHPSVDFSSTRIREAFLRANGTSHLSFIPPTQEVVIERADALISILAPKNTRALAGVDPERLAIANRAMSRLTDIYMRRWASGELDWTIAQFPTEAAAQDAGMSLRDYEDFVYGAGLLDQPDPVSAWRDLGRRQERLVERLSSSREVHIVGPATDLRVGVEARTWLNDCGKGNFPGGEVYTSPLEVATEGTIEFNLPAVFGGREVDGVRLEFREGRVVAASARVDESYLHQMLDLDEGARCLGEFAIGTNTGIQRFTRNTLFDEKIGGTVHMALGQSIPETGGNNTSALHWDMVFDLRQGGELYVDGDRLDVHEILNV